MTAEERCASPGVPTAQSGQRPSIEGLRAASTDASRQSASLAALHLAMLPQTGQVSFPTTGDERRRGLKRRERVKKAVQVSVPGRQYHRFGSPVHPLVQGPQRSRSAVR